MLNRRSLDMSRVRFFKNVDAGGAKELMAHLVKLQSSLSEVNKYVSLSLSHICTYNHTQ